MARKTETYRFFNVISWLFFGVILFLSGLGHQSLMSSFVRNGLFVIIGLSLSWPLRSLYELIWKKYESLVVSVLGAFALSYIAGVITGLILNPITFFGFHGGLGDNPFFALFAGVLNFAFVFMIWSACYYAYKYYLNQPSGEEKSRVYPDKIPIDVRKQIILVKTEEITHIKAEGDYVRVYACGKSYLLRKPLSHIEGQLDPGTFKRIHRSSIVNTNYIASLRPHMNGEFFLLMEDGTNLKLSRSYKHVLRSYIDAL